MKILVTGAAGFIGFHTVCALAARGEQVVGLDNLNAYYDVKLKYGRLATAGIARESLSKGVLVASSLYPSYRFVQTDITDGDALKALFSAEQFDVVIHLAAQAGVRYSIENPDAYVASNITGFLRILEACRHHPVQHLIYASSSSVYGLNEKIPYAESDSTDRPVSLYATTKKSNEAMAHAYGQLFGIRSTGLRFFTVYGPWGRPDMAPYLFLEAIVRGRPIQVFNQGDLARDFTYVDDVVSGIVAVADGAAPAMPAIYNIGRGEPVALMDFIRTIETVAGREAIKEFREMQSGDVYRTWADTSALERKFGYRPTTSLSEGITRFYAWYMQYHA